MNYKGVKTKLNIIGGGPGTEKIKNLVEHSRYKEYCNLTLWCNDKNIILDNYRKSDIFVMLSSNETFGITYLEAMTQGLPIIYTKNDGIDGFFKNNRVGLSLEIGNTLNYYYENIMNLVNEKNNISKECLKEVVAFSWKSIGEKYIEIYNESIM